MSGGSNRRARNSRPAVIPGRARKARYPANKLVDPVKLRSRRYSPDGRRSGCPRRTPIPRAVWFVFTPKTYRLRGVCFPARLQRAARAGRRLHRPVCRRQRGISLHSETDQTAYMQRALALARQAEGRTSPNPLVGAVLVKQGRIIGEGFHHHAGAAHAEIEALRAAGPAARDATLFVTLEPCAHHGRTPPCTDAIIAAGVAEVIYAVGDPNPNVDRKGHAQLAVAGLRVRRGVCADDAHALNRPFFKYISTGRPFVTAKFAMSLDGKIATHTGDARWIAGAAARRQGHQLRNVSDVILVGVGTVVADDPRLTTRLDQANIRHPLRVVVDSRGRAPGSARLFDPTLPGQTVLATTAAADADYCAQLRARGVEVWTVPADAHNRVSLPAVLDEIGRRKLLTVMVEGGGEVLGAFFTQRLVDRVWVFVAPIIIGGARAPGPVGGQGAARLAQALHLDALQFETLDKDLWLQADVLPPKGG